jgi:hypothetical protein
MYRYFGLVLLEIVLGLCAPNVRGQVTPAGRDFSLPRAEVSLTYSPTAVNSGPSQCGCFVISGAAVEGNFRTYRGFTTVVDVTASYTNDIHNTGVRFAVIMATGGIRLNYRVGADRMYRLKPFMQGLVGAAHGFDSAFPNKSGYIQPTANSLALLAGVGVDYKFRRHLSFRVIQGDFGYTRLPNGVGNDQMLVRLSTGITVHLR